MILFLLSCSQEPASKPAAQQQTAGIDTANISECGLTSESHIEFERTAAKTAPVSYTLTLQNTCEHDLVLIGQPDTWLEGDGFGLQELPDIAITAGQSTELILLFTPDQAGQYSGTLTIQYDDSSSPLEVQLQATVDPPLPLVLVGSQRHTATSLDYGQSFVFESHEPTQDSNWVQKSICYGASLFVSVGGNSERKSWTSSNATDWLAHSQEGQGIGGCAYGNDRFVGFDNDIPLYSFDGQVWNDGAATGWLPDQLRDIVYGDGIFIAVGNEGRISTTTDGLKWENDFRLGNFPLHAIAYGNETYVTAGSFGAVLTSHDNGQTWTEQRIGTSIFQRVLYGSGHFFLANGSEIFISEDGDVWTLVNSDGIKPIAVIGSLFFGTREQQLYWSQDNCQTWSERYTFQSSIPFFDAIIAGEQQ